MGELAYKILKEYGFPTLVAIALGYFIVVQFNAAADERASYTKLVYDNVADLQQDVEKLKSLCVK